MNDHDAYYAIQRAGRQIDRDPRVRAARAAFRAAGKTSEAYQALKAVIHQVRAEVYPQHGLDPDMDRKMLIALEAAIPRHDHELWLDNLRSNGWWGKPLPTKS